MVGDCETEITYCPYCGEKLPLYLPESVTTITKMTTEEVYKTYGVNLPRDDEEQVNYAKKSTALVLSGYLDITEQSAEYLVDMLIEAVKHELKGGKPND